MRFSPVEHTTLDLPSQRSYSEVSARSRSGGDEEDPSGEELGIFGEDFGPPVPTPSEPLEESVYGYVMASLINDSADIKLHGLPKLARILSAFVLFLVMFSTQVYLLAQTKKLVSPPQVANARVVYGKFEKVMYTDVAGVSHTWNTTNGYPRGIGGVHGPYFNASNFDKLSTEEKDAVCTIPLSQPWFLFIILNVWALAVLNTVRNAANMAYRFAMLPRLSCLDDQDGLSTTADGVEVVGMALWLKSALILVIILPRIIMCCFLLWLGSRWLTATLGFGDVMLNSLALLLILDLAELIYHTVVPYHGKRLVQRTLVPHVSKEEPETCCTMFGMMFLGILATAFSALYMTKLQLVLPGYNWDVRDVCQSLLIQQASV